MKAFAALAAGLTLLAGAAIPLAAQASGAVVDSPAANLQVEAGKGRLIHLDQPARTVFIADPKVADVQVKSPTLVYVVGKAPGTTSLFAVDGADHMILNLSVNVGYDEARLQALIQREAPDAKVEVTSLQGALVLSGSVRSAAEGDDILRMAARFVGTDEKGALNALINRLTVDGPNQINLRVRVAEVSRTASNALGFRWQGGLGGSNGSLGLAVGGSVLDKDGAFLPGADGASTLLAGLHVGDVDLNVALDALEKKNLVQVLAEPNLTAVSGEPASFLAGGEYPIPVPQGLNQVVIQYKKFGVSLSFVATILDGGRISLNVEPEVSQLSNTGAITLNGFTVPALTTRRAQTTVDLASGQSFAIAGLLQNTTAQDVSKFPGLGDVPVLGQLFRSKTFQHNQSELVIIVTPYLVKPVSHKLATPTDLLIAKPAPDAAQVADSHIETAPKAAPDATKTS